MSFHDGKLLGFCLLPSKQCEIYILDANKKPFKILLSEIEEIRADNFKEGNIILDVTFTNGDLVSKSEIFEVLSLEDGGVYTDFANGILERVRAKSLSLFQISPSYGCSFLCLCKECRVQENEA